ncbi:DUF5779 family protein [Halorubellus salinus]|uniref:DUF5779 family protein n=1 Tax=Halorubellus salinus TaxID=755309 RepID=UPI001D0882EB|nr:DUF5779 family protein [Halorubellus salinus]
MSDFDLDLRAVEDHLDDEDEDADLTGSVRLGVLDGTTPSSEWYDTVMDGNVLVLDVKGDVNELAAGFARDIREDDGSLVHFRGFLIVSPPGIDIDTSDL